MKALPIASLVLAGCGARTSLLVDDATSSSSTSSSGAGGSAGSGGGSNDGGSPTLRCHSTDDPASWPTEEYRDSGDYETGVAATSGLPWVALKPRNGNVVFVNLGVDATGIVENERVEVPDAAVYPLGFDVDDRRFVMVASRQANANGPLDVWRVDRRTGQVRHRELRPSVKPDEVADAAIVLSGERIFVGHGWLSDDIADSDILDDRLRELARGVGDADGLIAVHDSDTVASMWGVGFDAWRTQGDDLVEVAADPEWELRGGLEKFTLSIGRQVQQFRFFDGTREYLAPWPHSQISPPTVIRHDGDRIAVLQETELTAVVGHVHDDVFAWMPIVSSASASGSGLGLIPVVDETRLGLFYLGFEIPSPEQPLRYFGHVCPN